eukprot:CAMPEP_0117740616 /NCGR_PEP_ID=MMETSP0947-20121206/4446_1 /TAXON_ID=44440 /ORGANISM="Chattonella subsalsa, Strain CCMP2191" /LENGTH=388 /DNA_ID=CAMNT_0005556761 /DNA_START=126 /DNA_END=1295 /DNA_ORIENTATION=+
MPPPTMKSMASKARQMGGLAMKPGMVPSTALKKKTSFAVPAPAMRNKPSAAGLPPPAASFQADSMVPPAAKSSSSEFSMPAPKGGSISPPPTGGGFPAPAPKEKEDPPAPAANGGSAAAPIVNIHSEVSDPYDPARPNDYTAFCKERVAKRKEEERQRELKKYMEQQEQERAKLEEARRLAAEGLGPFNMGAAARGRGRAGRGRGVSNLPAWMSKQEQKPPATGLPRPGGDSEQFKDEVEGPNGPQLPSPAQRPSGPGTVPPPGPGSMLPPPKPKKKGLFSNPTKVVLLKNMVGPGEVDADLAPETKEECTKYGPVKECVVHEETDKNLPDEEIVRTFVAFERQDAAIKAFMDMNGRFFAGRQITAVFFKEDKFDRRELEYTPGEGDS